MQNKQPFVNGEALPNVKFIAVKDHGQPEAVYKASGRVFYAVQTKINQLKEMIQLEMDNYTWENYLSN